MSFPCPTCGDDMSTLATREYERRRQCPRGHRVTTIEITKEAYDKTAQDLEYLKNLKLALATNFQNFSKELYDLTDHSTQLRLPGF